MLKRKIINDFLAWKNNPRHYCLLVKGARQVGKTFIIREFCRESYDFTIEINFDANPELAAIFDGSLEAENIYRQISLYLPNANLVPHKTVIFLDEIQHCPNARTALKFLAMDKKYDVIASGSLLGINYKEVRSFPVGYVDHLEMHSLDFEEFLWAKGYDEQRLGYLKEYFDNKEVIPAAIHHKMLEQFKEYIVVGGMPAVVVEFLETNNFAQVLRVQRSILEEYNNDIAKYAMGSEKTKARECFLAVPKNLSKDYKKFQYSSVEKNGTKKKYGGSLMWLYDTGIINFCYNLSIPELPLEGNSKSDEFKVYMRDTGLLVAMLEDGTQKDIMAGKLGIYKGAIYENIIADSFTKSGKKLYYYGIPNKIEIDFFIRKDDMATAIEVKSSENTKSKSLTSIISHYGVEKGIKLSAKNIGEYEKILYLPLYMAMFL